jgi:hypothetical protein
MNVLCKKGKFYGSRKVPPVSHRSLEVASRASLDYGFLTVGQMSKLW